MTLKCLRGLVAATLLLAGSGVAALAGGPSAVPLNSSAMDFAFGSVVGGTLCRTSSGWAIVPAGSAGQIYTVPSGGGCPAWAAPAGGGNVSNTGTPAAGQVALFTNATTVQGVNTLPVSAGGTGAATAAAARSSLGAAASGANSDITGLSGLTAPIPLVAEPAPADGCVRVSVASSTSLNVGPYGCNTLSIGGVPRTEVAHTCSNANLSAGANFYVYEYVSGSATTCFFTGTGHITGSDGREYLNNSGSPNTAYRLVALIRTDGNGNFGDNNSFRGCINWFNRRNLQIQTSANNVGTSSTSATVITNVIGILAWSDEIYMTGLSGEVTNNTSGQGSYTFVQVNGGNVAQGYYSGTGFGDVGLWFTGGLTEGWNTFSVAAQVSGGSGSSYSALSLSATTRG